MAFSKPPMKKFLLLPILIAIAACTYKKPKITRPRTPVAAYENQQGWNYGQLAHTIKNARVIAHVKSGMFCGRATCASVSIVEVNKNDTIRVLELCSTHQGIDQGAKVNITPGKKPLSSVSLPVIAAYDHKGYKTYYGTLLRAN
jgi:hypothetical protein